MPGGLNFTIASNEQDATVIGGTATDTIDVALPEHGIETLTLGLGTHEIELAVDDGVNEAVLATVMVEVILEANAYDNAGEIVPIAVEVESSELPEFDGYGYFLPDHEIVDVDEVTGVIVLDLRAERSGKGDGRTYTVTITATTPAATAPRWRSRCGRPMTGARSEPCFGRVDHDTTDQAPGTRDLGDESVDMEAM